MQNLNPTRMSQGGRRELIKSEGAIPHVYNCQAGHPTIAVGYMLSKSERSSGKIHLTDGSVIDYRKGDLSNDQMMALLSDCLIKYEKAVSENVKVPISQENYDALVHFTFSVGIGAFKKSTLLKKLNAGDFNEVPKQIKRWVYVTIGDEKQVSKGLTNRREKEAQMFLGAASQVFELKELIGQQAGQDTHEPEKSLPFNIPGLTASHSTQSEDNAIASGGLSDYRKQIEAELRDSLANEAKEQAKLIVEAKTKALKQEALDDYIVNNTQQPHQSRTNQNIVKGLISFAIATAVSKYGLPAEFNHPIITSTLEALTYGAGTWFSGRAIHFRNIATKIIK